MQARIADILWHQDQKRGAAILPKQLLHIGHWISFPTPPTLIPFDYTENGSLKLNENDTIHLLLETQLVPNKDNNGILLVSILPSMFLFVNFKFLYSCGSD